MLKLFLYSCFSAFFALLVLADQVAAQSREEMHAFLVEEGILVTNGDVPGYVPDSVCADCHGDKAESFSEMGMARSFYRPSQDNVIEKFSDEAYFHEVTQRLYGMELREGDYWFTRHSRAPDGSLLDEFSVKVDWIMGSGNHSRVYMYQSDDGAMFQLPLAWYTQDQKWGMAPGFEFKDHLGVSRDVPQRCMGCHNAYANYSEQSGEAGMPRLFPHDLPEGIGCQRCHGPGEEHVFRALSGSGEIEELRNAIVNPGNLPREKLYSVCYGCHMQPTVSVNSQLRLGRSHYSFRPGEDLREFLAHIDIVDDTRSKDQRFDINHHPYRLEQSACFVQSQGQLGCLTCHDPHVKISPANRAAHYKQACASCHELDEENQPLTTNAPSHPEIDAAADCTSCHMPNRRTQDVIEVWMTDHRITRFPGEDLLKPISKEPAVVSEVFLADPDSGLPADEAKILQLIAILQYTTRQSEYAADELANHLKAKPTSHFEPYLNLMQTYIRQQRYAEARDLANLALARNPDHPRMILVVALSYALTGEPELAITMLENLLQRRPELVDTRYNLMLVLWGQKKAEEALEQAEIIIDQRPNHWQTWRLAASIHQAQGHSEQAIEAYLRTLSIAPQRQDARQILAGLLEDMGRPEDAAQHKSLIAKD